jgi:hypothetical protein
MGYAFDFFLAAQRAFIIADNFFRMAALIGLRAADFLETGVAFLRSGFPFCFAPVLVGQPLSWPELLRSW